jgi:hypothetical protein
MNRTTALRLLNVVALVAVLATNFAATALPLNGRDTGAISDSYPVLFTPAGYVFAIWGVIYLLLIGFVAYQLRPAPVDVDRLGRINGFFVLGAVANIAWLFCWHYDKLLLSEVFMLTLLGSLIGIYRRLGIGQTVHFGAGRWLVDLPFSVYLGWISVATIANTAILLYSLGWNGAPFGPDAWTIVMLGVAAVLGLVMARRRHDAAFVLVLAWAFFGIGAARAAVYETLSSVAMLGAWILLGAAVWAGLRAYRDTVTARVAARSS